MSSSHSISQSRRGDEKVAGGKRVFERNYRFEFIHKRRTPEERWINLANL
jgi:hypothetical protein